MGAAARLILYLVLRDSFIGFWQRRYEIGD